MNLRIIFAAAFVVHTALSSTPLQAASVWIEAEAFTEASKQPTVNDWGAGERMSGQAVQYFATGKELAQVPQEGYTLTYTIDIDEPGMYTLWHRVGFQTLRPTMRWRIGQGDWAEVSNEQPTTDIRLIRKFNELAWLEMGELTLPAGQHTFQIHIKSGETEAKGKPRKMLYVSDAFCLTSEPWRPHGTMKPGETFDSEADLLAAEQVYRLSPAADGKRSIVELSGPWQYARFDETTVSDRLGPVPHPSSAEADLHWRAIEVPGSRNHSIKEDEYGHRFVYRTKFEVPKSHSDQRLHLQFSETSFLTSVYVNGQLMHHTDIFATGWHCDITDAVRFGEVNELVIGIKDAVYALNPTDGRALHEFFHLETNSFIHGNQGVTRNFEYAIRGVYNVGLIDIVQLVATGPQRVDDVFVKPSVSDRSLGVELEVDSPGPTSAEIIVSIADHEAEQPTEELTRQSVRLDAGLNMFDLAAKWEDAELWWPDSPKLYDLITQVVVDGEVADTRRDTFGFREWTIVDTRFHLNGQPWKLITDTTQKYANPQELVDAYRESGHSMYRLRFQAQSGRQFGLTQRQLLESFDRLGLPVRRMASPLDGQVASYAPVIGRGEDRKPNMALFDNWRKQMLARVKFERNHPSIFVWETDNEFVYINMRNFGLLETAEPEVHRGAQMVMDLDPTRKIMTGGGRAGLNKFFPIYGTHYEERDAEKKLSFRDYPDEAYAYKKTWGTSRAQPWPMSHDRPVFHSEIYFADGYKPEDHAAIGGEQAFLGRAGTFDGADKFGKILSEGARWQGIAANHYWMSKSTVGAWGKPVEQTMYNAWNDYAMLCRQWNWSFGSGEKVTRDLRIFNDTRHDHPVTARYELVIDGETVASDEQTFEVDPGYFADWTIELSMPEVDEGSRINGELLLSTAVQNETVYTDRKPLAVLSRSFVPVPEVGDGEIAVWDASGIVNDRLKQRGIAYRSFEGLEALPGTASVMLIGPDTLDRRVASDPRWVALAEQGKRIVVLDHEVPLHYQAVTADFEISDFVGRIMHIENGSHPILNGIEPIDLDTWGPDHVSYRSPLKKGTRGLISLIQCDDTLQYTPLAESRVGDGTMIFSQLLMSEKLGEVAAADRIFDQMVNYALAYAPPSKTTHVVAESDSPLRKMLADSAVEHVASNDLSAVLNEQPADILVVEATPSNLETLLEQASRLDEFTARGGYLMLSGLTPEGLDPFNALVGVDHAIRPFFQEKVSLPAERDALVAGTSLRDVVLTSGERIVHYQSVEWLTDDAFSYIVDLDNPAPFGVPSGAKNTVNGMTSTDFWKYIHYINLEQQQPELTYDFPKRYRLTGFSFIPNTHYLGINEVTLHFDDGSTQTVGPIRPEDARQDFELEPVETRQVRLTFAWDEEPVGRDRPVIGIDNLWFTADRGEAFDEKVTPLLNVGGLVKYPRGQGAIVLNQLNIQERETNPINADKKKALYNVLLANMGAKFARPRVLRPGQGLAFDPVSLEDVCNAYLKAGQGWHDASNDYAAMPLGEVRFGGVPFAIRDFRTSPLENAVVLKNNFPQAKSAPKSIAIEVDRKADAVFFLHSFIKTREWQPTKQKDGSIEKREAFEYVVHFSDGKTQRLPIVWGEDVAKHWLQVEPGNSLKSAPLAWDGPAGAPGQFAVAHRFQWDNNRPETAIDKIVIAYSEQEKNAGWLGSPILFGVTTATAQK